MRKLKHENKKRVNLRLEPSLITALRRVADREGVAYQKMIRQWLWEKVKKKAEGT
ncbi:CopG family antitoxin [Desulfofundulus kuznetsovii]|uniref:CopG family antitoxin n=1 Tax=Desulfofundulus kuznetsovii TaxID=58135 RepID=UPI0002D3DBA1